MNKLIKAHADYYEYEHHSPSFFQIYRKQSDILLLMNDEFDCCLICDRHLNVLHEIGIGSGGTFPSMCYVSYPSEI